MKAIFLLTAFAAAATAQVDNPTIASRDEMMGKPAPEFELATLDDKTVSLSDLRGKVVLLEFWASWCAPCRTQMPAIAALYNSLKDQGLVLLGVNEDENEGAAVAYLKELGFSDWQSIYDKHVLMVSFMLRVIPALILIDKDGIIVEYQIGSAPPATDKIVDALKKQGFQLP